jgi:hypothetical protein
MQGIEAMGRLGQAHEGYRQVLFERGRDETVQSLPCKRTHSFSACLPVCKLVAPARINGHER